VQKDAEEQIISRFLPVAWQEQERIDAAMQKYSKEQRAFVYQEVCKWRGQEIDEEELQRRVGKLMDQFEKKRFGDIRVREANILLSGCRADQQSADAYIAGDFHGAFTHHIAEAITQSNGQITYFDLAQRAGKKMFEAGFSQIPQLECRAIWRQKMAFQPF
jgi:hypothetical protein